MEEKRRDSSHSFTWGMLVGGAIVLMLTTKKGREVLKELTNGGLEGIEEFIDIEKVKELTSEFGAEDDSEDEGEEKEKPRKRRRLFKGIRK